MASSYLTCGGTCCDEFVRTTPRFENSASTSCERRVAILSKHASESDGEISGVFLCHGHPVKSDLLSDTYTNRPWKRVFEAIEKVREQLARCLLLRPLPTPITRPDGPKTARVSSSTHLPVAAIRTQSTTGLLAASTSYGRHRSLITCRTGP